MWGGGGQEVFSISGKSRNNGLILMGGPGGGGMRRLNMKRV